MKPKPEVCKLRLQTAQVKRFMVIVGIAKIFKPQYICDGSSVYSIVQRERQLVRMSFVMVCTFAAYFTKPLEQYLQCSPFLLLAIVHLVRCHAVFVHTFIVFSPMAPFSALWIHITTRALNNYPFILLVT